MDIRSLVEPSPALHVLPVPLSRLQVDVTRELIFGNYSEILNYFEKHPPGSHSSRASSEQTLIEMLHRLEAVATHPWLFVPSLRSQSLNLREAPGRMEDASGKFAVLGQLVRALKGTGVKRLAVVAAARYPTTPNAYMTHMVQAYLNGLGVPSELYTAGDETENANENSDERRKNGRSHGANGRISGTSGSGGSDDELRAFVVQNTHNARLGAEFDLVIFINNAEVAVDAGVRAVRLVAPYTADHVSLPGSRLDFKGRLAATVVMHRDLEVGDPDSSYLQHFLPFITQRGSWPLRTVVPMPRQYNRIDVERALSSSTPGVGVAGAPTTNETGAPTNVDGPTAKRLKVEPGVADIAVAVDPAQLLAELASHRALAARRQNHVDALVDEVAALVADNERLKKDAEVAKKRRERARDDMRAAVEHARALGERWTALEQRLRSSGADELRADVARAEQTVDRLRSDLEHQEKRAQNASETLEFMRDQYQTASQAAAELRDQKEAADAEIAALKRTIDSLKQLPQEHAAQSLLKDREDEIRWLKGELESVQAAVKIAEDERQTQQPSRERSRQPR